MTLQTLPPLVREYGRRQDARIDWAVDEVTALWRGVGPRFDSSWSLIGGEVSARVAEMQLEVASAAVAYVPDVLGASGGAVVAEYVPVADEFVGLTGAGVPVSSALSLAPVRAKQAIARGESPMHALESAGAWLTSSVVTILADTQRATESIGVRAHGVGYVRCVQGGACGRCVVQAGKWFRSNDGFLRHPKCKCFHVPARESVPSWQTNPDDYFESLSPSDQVHLMGSKANAQAVRDGADIGQIVNAYRKSDGLQVAGLSAIQSQTIGKHLVKYTTAGTTRRGSAYKSMRNHGAVNAADDVMVKGQRYSRTQVVRVMPETIYKNAASPEEAKRLLKLYGWVL